MNQTEIFEFFQKVEENLHVILILSPIFFILFLLIATAECYNAYTLTCNKITPQKRGASNGQSIHSLDVIG